MTTSTMTGPALSTPARAATLPGTFWALWAAQLINRVASFAQPFLLLYLTDDRQLSAPTAGAVVSGVGLGSVVATVAGGWAADLLGRRVSMLAGLVLNAGALLWLAGATDLWALAASSVLIGVGGDLVRPAMNATVSDTVPQTLQVRAYGLLFWAVNLGFSVATVSAGLLTRWGYPVIFVINAVASLIAASVILRWVPESRPPAADVPLPFLRTLVRDVPTLVLVLVGTVYSVVYFQAYSTLPLVMTEQGLSPAVYGLVLAVNGVVICLLQPVAVRIMEQHRPERVYALGNAVVGLGFAATSLAGSAWAHGLVVVVWTVGEIAVAGVVGALFSRRAPEALRGRYLSLVSLSFAVGAAVGPLAGTAVLDAAGPTVLWLGCGAVMLLAATAATRVRD